MGETGSVRLLGGRLAVVALILAAGVGGARAGTSISGQVLGPAGVTPIPQAQVTFYNLATGMTYRSDPAGPEGRYALADLAPGRYDVAVETPRGLWLVDRPITLHEGEVRTFSFALRERAYWEGADAPTPRSTPLGDNVVGTAVILEEERNRGAPPGRARKLALIGTASGVGILALALLAGDDDENPQASPSAP